MAALASDDLAGRDNQSPGSERAQALLIDELMTFAEPADPSASGRDGYLQPFDVGTNVVARVPGSDFADEYVMIGAHYDHLASGDCNQLDDPTDVICNGATDNATGVAAVMAIARAVAQLDGPRRSLLVAFWDAEEDGLLGARHFVDEPIVPVEQIVTYLNFDIQGSTLTPGLADHTVAVGAETGGDELVAAVARAAAPSSGLTTLQLSVLFGQGRSDHAPFAGAGVPIVFLTDATDGCYHTVADDLDAVDFAKLDEQVVTGIALTTELLTIEPAPVFDDAAPPVGYDDAVALLALLEAAGDDVAVFAPESTAEIAEIATALRSVVDAGAGAFDQGAAAVVIIGAGQLIQLFERGPCVPG